MLLENYLWMFYSWYTLIIKHISILRSICVVQVLHKIDEVLVPTRSPQSASRKLFNPTALEFLENYESLIQNPHRVR